MRFDQSETFEAGVIIAPAAYDDDNTLASFALGKAQSATILIAVGVGGITFSAVNKVEFKLTHSDTTDGSFTAVTQDDIVGVDVGEGGIVRSLVEAHAAPTVTKVGYKGRKGFLRLLAEFAGTHGSATPMSATVLTGNLDRVEPVAPS